MKDNLKYDERYNYKKWRKIGLFDNPDIARRTLPHLFRNPKFEAYFTLEGRQDALWVNKEYYDSQPMRKDHFMEDSGL